MTVDPTLCACGCGGEVRPRRRFVHGHNRIGTTHSAAQIRANRAPRPRGVDSPHFGMKRSLEAKAKMRSAKLGGKLTAEHRARIGAAETGERHWNWKGGRHHSSDRYVVVWVDADHPMVEMAGWRNGRRYIREHRLVMATHLGRPLTRREVVHHLLPCEGGSGDPTDNRVEVLRLFADQALHRKHHANLEKVGEDE